jgi:hypothetical protein
MTNQEPTPEQRIAAATDLPSLIDIFTEQVGANLTAARATELLSGIEEAAGALNPPVSPNELSMYLLGAVTLLPRTARNEAERIGFLDIQAKHHLRAKQAVADAAHQVPGVPVDTRGQNTGSSKR